MGGPAVTKKVLLIIIIILAAVIGAGAVTGFVLMNKYRDLPTFMNGTTLNDEPVDGETPEEVAERFAAQFDTDRTTVQIKENGSVSIEGTLKEFGYSYDKNAFLEFLTESRDDQRSDIFQLISTMMNGYRMTASESYLYDSQAVASIVTSSNLAEKRVKTTDNGIVFDEKENRYHVEEGSTGNEIDDEALQQIVSDTLYEAVNAEFLPGEIVIDIPEDVYISLPPAGDLTQLQQECDEKNLELQKQEIVDRYKQVVITHQFGQTEETLGYDIFSKWMTVNDDLSVSFDTDSVDGYVTWLKEVYDTLYLDRTFTTTTGKTITIPASTNEYGYSIDYIAECDQLLSDLQSGESVTREPVYVETNDYGNLYYYSRNGEDDLNGTYVEVNLTKQHLWYYVNGELLVDCDIVSGSVAKKAETQTGAFPLAWKQSPETLTGEDAAGSDSYSVEVQYWMPFFNGQGLHDASFRSEFGGDIYKQNGSHGCVNLPPAAAETIYNNIELGVPIIIYKE